VNLGTVKYVLLLLCTYKSWYWAQAIKIDNSDKGVYGSHVLQFDGHKGGGEAAGSDPVNSSMPKSTAH